MCAGHNRCFSFLSRNGAQTEKKKIEKKRTLTATRGIRWRSCYVQNATSWGTSSANADLSIEPHACARTIRGARLCNTSRLTMDPFSTERIQNYVDHAAPKNSPSCTYCPYSLHKRDLSRHHASLGKSRILFFVIVPPQKVDVTTRQSCRGRFTRSPGGTLATANNTGRTACQPRDVRATGYINVKQPRASRRHSLHSVVCQPEAARHLHTHAFTGHRDAVMLCWRKFARSSGAWCVGSSRVA